MFYALAMKDAQLVYDPTVHAALLVELEYVSDVHAFLDELRNRGHLAVVRRLEGADEVLVTVAGQGQWTRAMVQDLARSGVSDAMRTVLSVLAERTPEVVKYS